MNDDYMNEKKNKDHMTFPGSILFCDSFIARPRVIAGDISILPVVELFEYLYGEGKKPLAG